MMLRSVAAALLCVSQHAHALDNGFTVPALGWCARNMLTAAAAAAAAVRWLLRV